MEKHRKTDIAIIGGGASGYAAAIGVLNSSMIDTVILERLNKTGRKILATGNGRCNLSNKNINSKAYHGSFGDVIRIINKMPSAENFFRDMGVLCTSDEQGRIYPRSNNAASILGALRLYTENIGLNEICGFQVKSIEGNNGNYTLYSDEERIECKKIIIAAGGYASPAFGTDGSMLRLLKEMGYKTAKIYPAVAPLKVNADDVRGLKGVRAKGKVTAISKGNILREEYGEIQFTENSLSGICVFNLAYLMSEHEGDLSVCIDFMPDMKAAQLEEFLCYVQAMRYDNLLEEFLTGIFPKNLAVYIMKHAVERPLNDVISSLKYPEIQKIIKLIKSLEFKIKGSSSWQNAQVTSGGIHASCVDEKMESRIHKGLYFCGEILDVDGDCGGYNLQWAWSSGLYAGEECAKAYLQEKRNDTNK